VRAKNDCVSSKSERELLQSPSIASLDPVDPIEESSDEEDFLDLAEEKQAK